MKNKKFIIIIAGILITILIVIIFLAANRSTESDIDVSGVKIKHIYCTLSQEDTEDSYYLSAVSMNESLLNFAVLRRKSGEIIEKYSNTGKGDGVFDLDNKISEAVVSFGDVILNMHTSVRDVSILNSDKGPDDYAFLKINVERKSQIKIGDSLKQVTGSCSLHVMDDNKEKFSEYKQLEIILDDGTRLITHFDIPAVYEEEFRTNGSIILMPSSGKQEIINDFELKRSGEIKSTEAPYHKIAKDFEFVGEKINLKIKSTSIDPFLNPCLLFNNGDVTGVIDGEIVSGYAFIAAAFGQNCFSQSNSDGLLE